MSNQTALIIEKYIENRLDGLKGIHYTSKSPYMSGFITALLEIKKELIRLPEITEFKDVFTKTELELLWGLVHAEQVRNNKHHTFKKEYNSLQRKLAEKVDNREYIGGR